MSCDETEVNIKMCLQMPTKPKTHIYPHFFLFLREVKFSKADNGT